MISYTTEEVLTLGLATPLVAEQAATLIASWSARIAIWLKALIASLRRLAGHVTNLGKLVNDLKTILNRLRSQAEPVPAAPPSPAKETVPTSKPEPEVAKPGEGYRTPAKGSPEWLARQEELAMDPAHGNRISAKTRREAEVGLDLEADGTLPGPLKRTPLDYSDPANPRDQGDLTDATKQDWDVKTPVDIFPAGRQAGQIMPAGQPGRYNGQRIENTIASELEEGKMSSWTRPISRRHPLQTCGPE